MRRLAFILAAAMIGLTTSGHAQLIRERVEDDRRICTYFGSDRLPNDQIVARELTVNFGEDCPSTAPGPDASGPVPPNARFLREEEQDGQRLCVYGQANREWTVSLPMALKCASTPAMQQSEPRTDPR